MDVKQTVANCVEQVAKAQNKAIPAISDQMVLLESGLDSLCFAIIVATLEDELGVDAFASSEEIHFPVTLLDFVKLYERSL